KFLKDTYLAIFERGLCRFLSFLLRLHRRLRDLHIYFRGIESFDIELPRCQRINDSLCVLSVFFPDSVKAAVHAVQFYLRAAVAPAAAHIPSDEIAVAHL